MSNMSPIQAPIDNSDTPAVDPGTATALERLINVCADGVEGHKRSATLVQDQVARSLFELWSRERADFLTALQELGSRYGVSEDDPGTLAAVAHRAWLGAIETISGDGALIEAAARGERAAMDTYEAALDLDLPAKVRNVVQLQYDHIREIHERLVNWDAV